MEDKILFSNGHGFSSGEIALYGRQILLSEIGTVGQQRLKSSRVAVVGAGGLGSPACLYLATSGIGFLRIIDGDIVEVTNLHRLKTVGINKAASAQQECRQRNDQIIVEALQQFLTWDNSEELLGDVDVVIDASDNARTRYIVGDACVALQKPLVSGSALRWEGQLSVYNLNANTILKNRAQTLEQDEQHALDSSCPCYRCVYPTLPIANNAGTCDAEGVIGPAPGVIGVLQAVECIKICLGLFNHTLRRRLLLLDLLNPLKMFRHVQLRHRRLDCAICGEGSSVELLAKDFHILACPDLQYPQIPPHQSISSQKFFNEILEIVVNPNNHKNFKQQENKVFDNNQYSFHCLKVKEMLPDTVVVDVRRPHHFNAIHIQGTLNFPANELTQQAELTQQQSDSATRAKIALLSFYQKLGVVNTSKNINVYFLCRRGRDSSRATAAFTQLTDAAYGTDEKNKNKTTCWKCFNVEGGLFELRKNITALKDFPVL